MDCIEKLTDSKHDETGTAENGKNEGFERDLEREKGSSHSTITHCTIMKRLKTMLREGWNMYKLRGEWSRERGGNTLEGTPVVRPF